MKQTVSFPKKYGKHVMPTKIKNCWSTQVLAKSKFLYKMRYSVTPPKNKNVYNFPINKLCIAKVLKG